MPDCARDPINTLSRKENQSLALPILSSSTSATSLIACPSIVSVIDHAALDNTFTYFALLPAAVRVWFDAVIKANAWRTHGIITRIPFGVSSTRFYLHQWSRYVLKSGEEVFLRLTSGKPSLLLRVEMPEGIEGRLQEVPCGVIYEHRTWVILLSR